MIEMFGYDYDTKEIKNDPFEDREISELMYDLLELTYSLDYYLSGDISKEDYLNDKRSLRRNGLVVIEKKDLKNILMNNWV